MAKPQPHICVYCGREYQLDFLARHCAVDHEKEAGPDGSDT